MSQFSNWNSLKSYVETAHLQIVAEESLRYNSRDLSWLSFNDRVLAESFNLEVPLLERLRFIAICSSNLDEFFMVRVAEISLLARRTPSFKFPDGHSALQVLTQIRDRVRRQKAHQTESLNKVISDLTKENIFIYNDFKHKHFLDSWIRKRLPEIEIIVCPLTSQIPFVNGSSLNVFVLMEKQYAILRFKNIQDRLLIKEEKTLDKNPTLHTIFLERWLCARAQEFFPGQKITETFSFRILRDADLRLRVDNEDNLEDQIVQAVQRRSRGRIVRLEVDYPIYSEGVFFLAAALNVDSVNLYRFDLPLGLSSLFKIYNHNSFSELKYPLVQPQIPRIFLEEKSVFNLIRKSDILLHHPYDSFDCVMRLLQEAANDPNVLEIYHTLYRTTQVSPVMESLKKAAANGKKVVVYVEIKARFDEINNVRWAADLRSSGVKVVRHFEEFKVHSKATLVLRKERKLLRLYAHLGTGNYHPNTAKQYTDLSLLTCKKKLVLEAQKYFKSLSLGQKLPEFKTLLVSPKNLHSGILKLIQDEINIQKKGGTGRIIAKMNSLTDIQIIEALYKASAAGVKVRLIVRGTCCLRAGVKGLSENIELISIVDRFLEHSRIYYFRSSGKTKIFLSSADWRERNFFRRYELSFPIEDQTLKKYIYEVILNNALKDNVKSWRLQPDGSYKPSLIGKSKIRSQFLFETLAKNFYKNTALEQR